MVPRLFLAIRSFSPSEAPKCVLHTTWRGGRGGGGEFDAFDEAKLAGHMNSEHSKLQKHTFSAYPPCIFCVFWLASSIPLKMQKPFVRYLTSEPPALVRVRPDMRIVLKLATFLE